MALKLSIFKNCVTLPAVLIRKMLGKRPWPIVPDQRKKHSNQHKRGLESLSLIQIRKITSIPFPLVPEDVQVNNYHKSIDFISNNNDLGI